VARCRPEGTAGRRHPGGLEALPAQQLSRDPHHFINTVRDLTKRGVWTKVLDGEGALIDTTTANGRLVFARALAGVRSR
jgi:hypothetical protein